jgi:uncharacterized membrane protein
MPYRWTDDQQTLTLWPHRSMTNRGFVLFMGVTCAMLTLPLMAVLGSPVLWALLPFMAVAVGGLWIALGRNDRDGTLTEVLSFRGDAVHLVQRDPKGAEQIWEANTYWVTTHLDRGDKPVKNYLTLKGSGREVELGAFLSPDERVALFGELSGRFGG